MKNRTAYTCPFLMVITGWICKMWLWRTYKVFWKSYDEEGYGDRLMKKKNTWSHGGMEVSCLFPKWMILTEHHIRAFYIRRIYGPIWIRVKRK